MEVFVLGGDVEGEGFEIIQRGDALSAEEFAEVGYLDIALGTSGRHEPGTPVRFPS